MCLRKVLTSAKYVIKNLVCHAPKANEISGKIINFEVNIISLSKVI